MVEARWLGGLKIYLETKRLNKKCFPFGGGLSDWERNPVSVRLRKLLRECNAAALLFKNTKYLRC